MKRLIVNILKWTLLVAYLIGMSYFTSYSMHNTRCSRLAIRVNKDNHFVDSLTVMSLLRRNNINTDSTNMGNLRLFDIENIIDENVFVKNVEVYSQFDGSLIIDILQRNPIIRVFTDDNHSFYIDDDRHFMPLYDKYAAKNVVALSGNINEANLLKHDSITNVYSLSDDMLPLYECATYIGRHKLWKHQIEQVYVADNQHIELVPRVGDHIIILGKPEDYKYKLDKLEAVYKRGLSAAGWDRYSQIDLRYSNQVICKKKH